MEIKKIGVIGAGAMGNGIAQVCAQSGYDVIMRDIKDEFVERGIKSIDKFLSKSVEKGKLAEDDKKNILGKIKGTTRLEDLKDVDFVVEVAPEKIEIKHEIFKELEKITRPEVILATNTSSISITKIAASVERQDKVIGMHFFNPVPLMKLVELIRGIKTSDETMKTTLELAQKLGKEPVEVNVDVAGFIVNRLMITAAIEAIKLYENGVASKEDIDKALKLGLNWNMGPFELMDFTGVDINLNVMKELYDGLPKELKWDPPVTIKNMVVAGMLGRKTGEGWFKY
ncbi:MAG: 3-hydroxybutyryl-CoA dehydrogenase [Spirochaetes bacterium]|nr:3-hydroxybutyryl-CoA dehydrogenase [Spirochaetota bacterium]